MVHSTLDSVNISLEHHVLEVHANVAQKKKKVKEYEESMDKLLRNADIYVYVRIYVCIVQTKVKKLAAWEANCDEFDDSCMKVPLERNSCS